MGAGHLRITVHLEPKLQSKLQMTALILQKTVGEIVREAIEGFFQAKLTEEQLDTLDLIADRHTDIAGTA